jgi:serine/threonine protein kinase
MTTHTITKQPALETEWVFVKNNTTLARLKFIKELGSGGIGDVFLCEKVKSFFGGLFQREQQQSQIALKVVKRTELITIIAEALDFIRAAKDVSIAEIYDAYMCNSNTHKGLYITMRYYPLGNLKDLISLHKQPFSKYLIASIGQNLFQALNYMHSNNVVHRDVSSDNIMVKEYDQECLIMSVVLSDFDTARPIEQTGTYTKGYVKKCTSILKMLQNWKEKIYCSRSER